MDTFLRKACNDDCNLLFRWANDKEVRENSFNSSEVTYSDHIKWFNEKLKSDTSQIFIFYLNDVPVGQVRIDYKNQENVISYSLDNSYRGIGLSKKMISLLEENLKDSVEKLSAYVKYDNRSSQRVFEKLEYEKKEFNDYIKYYKFI